MSGVRDPLETLTVAVLEPRVRAQHVEVSVSVDVDEAIGRDGAVDGGSDVMADPQLARMRGNPEPGQRVEGGVLVAHHHDVFASIAIHVSDDDVVCAGRAVGEGYALERFRRGLAGVAVTRRRCRPNRSHPSPSTSSGARPTSDW